MFIQRGRKQGYPDHARSMVFNPTGLTALLWELPFWFGAAIWTLLPTTKTPWLTLGDIPVNSRVILVLLLAGGYSVFLLDVMFREKNLLLQRGFHKTEQSAWAYHLPMFTGIIFLYMSLSVTWSGMTERAAVAMLIALAGAGAAFILGYMMISKRSPEVIEGFLWRVTILLAGIGLLYSAESFFTLGLRTETFTGGEFGIARVKGPLFASSTGFFVLLPALGFGIQMTLRRRWGAVLIVFALILTILGSGSRAGVYLLGLYVLLLILSIRGKQRLVTGVVFLVLTATAGAFVFSNAQMERLLSTTSEGRSKTHEIAWQLIENRGVIENLFGPGYGAYWVWYLQEADYRDEIFRPWKNEFRGVSTPYGRMLYHPHSVFLALALELGAVGVLYYTSLWGVLLSLLRRSIRGVPFSAFSLAVVASGFGMFFDLFIFRDPPLNVFWWIYLFGALALSRG